MYHIYESKINSKYRRTYSSKDGERKRWKVAFSSADGVWREVLVHLVWDRDIDGRDSGASLESESQQVRVLPADEHALFSDRHAQSASWAWGLYSF